MKKYSFAALTLCIATPVMAEESRQLGAHEHGVGHLNIAFDGKQIAMELHAPGADIVGFEYAAESAEDRSAVDNAVATLARPLDLFVLSDAAGCSVVQASATLAREEEHGEDHAEHEDHDHDHEEEHAKAEHKDQDHDHEEEHAKADHKEHGHDHEEEHAEADHKEHGHDDHADHAEADHEEHAGHTEFHAEYMLECANPESVTEITFAYFETFPNALEVEVQLISDSGASSFEVERDAPTLDLRGMF